MNVRVYENKKGIWRTIKGRLFYAFDKRVYYSTFRIDYSTLVIKRVYYYTIMGGLLYASDRKDLLFYIEE